MAYVALYRQWRPQDFDNLVGQEHISRTLKNAVSTGKIAHAYLFSGPRGTGKTSTAKILAKSLNCIHGPTPQPCNQCPNCERITMGTSMDVFEIDAASNRGIDEIRDLRETVKFAPAEGRYKVYIIDEVHMLTTEAFNALLKTLEEPPAHVVFVLATTEPHKIPATIHSRCQRYDFRRIGVPEIMARLSDVVRQSGLAIDDAALRLIAVHADGGLRDALSILDQCTAIEAEQITVGEVRKLLGLIGHEWVWRLTDAIAGRDAAGVLQILDELIIMGKDIRQLLVEMAAHSRSLMLYRAAPGIDNIQKYSDDSAVLEAQSHKFSHRELVNMIRVLHEAANETKWSPDPRIAVEVAMLSLCRRETDSDLANLVERISALEAKLAEQPARRVEPRPKVTPETAVEVKKTAVPENLALVHEVMDKPAGANQDRQVAQGQPAGPASAGQLKDIWDKVLKELLNEGKRSVHACVSQGKLTSLTDKQAIIRFVASFPKERTEKEDYRAIIEKVFAQVYGNQVRIQCILGAAETPPVVPKAPEPQPAPAPEEQHPVVRQALMMFGGKVIKPEQNEEV